MKEIANRAGVNELTIFRHFGSKESLIREVIHHCSPDSLLTESLYEQLNGSLRADFALLAQTFLGLELKELYRIRLGVIEAPQNPELLGVLAQVRNKLRMDLVSYLERLRGEGTIRFNNLELLAEIFYGILYQYILAQSDFPGGQLMTLATAEAISDAVASLFVNGLYNRGVCLR